MAASGAFDLLLLSMHLPGVSGPQSQAYLTAYLLDVALLSCFCPEVHPTEFAMDMIQRTFSPLLGLVRHERLVGLEAHIAGPAKETFAMARVWFL